MSLCIKVTCDPGRLYSACHHEDCKSIPQSLFFICVKFNMVYQTSLAFLMNLKELKRLIYTTASVISGGIKSKPPRKACFKVISRWVEGFPSTGDLDVFRSRLLKTTGSEALMHCISSKWGHQAIILNGMKKKKRNVQYGVHQLKAFDSIPLSLWTYRTDPVIICFLEGEALEN